MGFFQLPELPERVLRAGDWKLLRSAFAAAARPDAFTEEDVARYVELTAADLERPGDDPREFAALRHNLRQVERDYELELAHLRGHYEHSWSWRLTAPFRAAAWRVRQRRRNA
jgi:hypothetical protein